MRTRSVAAADSPFMTAFANADLLDSMLTYCPQEALARVAFANKAVASRVAVRAV